MRGSDWTECPHTPFPIGNMFVCFLSCETMGVVILNPSPIDQTPNFTIQAVNICIQYWGYVDNTHSKAICLLYSIKIPRHHAVIAIFEYSIFRWLDVKDRRLLNLLVVNFSKTCVQICIEHHPTSPPPEKYRARVLSPNMDAWERDEGLSSKYFNWNLWRCF